LSLIDQALYAAQRGYRGVLKQVLMTHPADCCNADGETLLKIAAQSNHIQVVEFLLQHGADINKADNNQRTALHSAAFYGLFDMVRFLIENGAKLEEREGYYRQTPLHVASSRGYGAIVLYLLQKGADRFSVDRDGWNSSRIANFQGHPQLAQLIT